MKSKEEIEQLVDEIYGEYAGYHKASFVNGYIKCQEDMEKELYEFGKLVLDTFHSEGKTHSGKDRLAKVKFDEWFNQVKKD